jgi:chromosome segregation ATPase
MTKLSDIFGRKSGEAGDKIIPLSAIPADISDQGNSGSSRASIDIGSLSEENELLRNLLSDTGRKVGELDELKNSFDRLVTPFHNALRALEQEKTLALNLAARLEEQRRAYETLREEVYAVEQRAGSLEAESEKLRSDLESAREQCRILDRERAALIDSNKEQDAQIAQLTREVEQESTQHRNHSEARQSLQTQLTAGEKRIAETEAELSATRERAALLDGEKAALQSTADQAMSEVARLTRRITEAENTLSSLRTQLGRAETNLTEAVGERTRIAAALEEAREQHQAERNTMSMRLEALQSRAATAERLLGEARQTLAARTEEARAFDRKAVDASIARTAAERRLAQIEGAHERRENMIRELEQTRHTLSQENAGLTKNLRSREAALARAEEKVSELTARNAQLEADLQVGRSGIDERVQDLQSALDRERFERITAEGALEGARKDNDRLHAHVARLRSASRRGTVAEGVAATSASELAEKPADEGGLPAAQSA